MNTFIRFISIVVLVSLSGCANYMYQGKMMATDSAGQERTFILYWPKTELLIGEDKAGPAVLLTECGTPMTFQQQPNGIIFRGSTANDRRLDQPPESLEDGAECGRFTNKTELRDIGPGPLSVTVQCVPISDEFSVVERTYLKASNTPYVFDITESKKWNLLGAAPDAPEPPLCDEER